MFKDAAELLHEALKLPPAARAALADSLVESLDPETDENAEDEWRAEIVRRLGQLDSGTVHAVAWDEVRRRLRQQLRG